MTMRWNEQLSLRQAAYLDRWLSRRAPTASSVRLEQRRIYILPTRAGFAFLGALMVMLLAAINYQNSLAYALTFLLGALFIVAILHTWRNLAGLVLQAGRAEPVFLGEQACFNIRLESSGRAHQSVGLCWQGRREAPVHFDVLANGASDAQLRLPVACRGWLRPGRIRVESRFPLGILVAWSWVDLGLSVLVYPRPHGDPALERSAGAEEEGEEGTSVRPNGVDDYRGLRSWQPGDSTRRLDWKAFSRGRGLLIKEFAGLSGSDRMLDFDTLQGDTEARLSMLCRWVVDLSEAEQAYGLRLPDAQIPVDQGDAHCKRCLQALALYGLPREGSS